MNSVDLQCDEILWHEVHINRILSVSRCCRKLRKPRSQSTVPGYYQPKGLCINDSYWKYIKINQNKYTEGLFNVYPEEPIQWITIDICCHIYNQVQYFNKSPQTVQNVTSIISSLLGTEGLQFNLTHVSLAQKEDKKAFDAIFCESPWKIVRLYRYSKKDYWINSLYTGTESAASLLNSCVLAPMPLYGIYVYM